MNVNTGAIAVFETDKDATRAGHTMPLTDKEAIMLRDMNRQQRRAWASQQRKAQRARTKRRK